MAIVFVSHRLAEVFAISDRIVVMRDGRIRGRHAAGDVTCAEIVAEMVGGVDTSDRTASAAPGPVALELRGLTLADPAGRQRVAGLDLTVRRGEIVGLFGLLGAGCIETALAAYGAWAGTVGGEIRVDGVATALTGPDAAVALGLGLLAQDRRDGLIGEQSVAENIGIASLGRITRRGLLDVPAVRRQAQDQVATLGIRTASIEAEVHTLSGGNQQKVQIARWLAAEVRILIMIDPTRGVDVGARREIKRIWSTLGARGTAILVHRHPRGHALLPRRLDDPHQRSDGGAAAPCADEDGDRLPAPAWSIAAVLLALTGYAALCLSELRRAEALGVAERRLPDLARALLPAAAAAAAAIWIVSWQGMPYLVLLVAICTLAAELVMRRTAFGARLYAIGGNPEAARLSGINIRRVIFWNFVIAGLGYGIAGVALTARVSGAIGGSAGPFLELDAIAAAIIGGTSLAGGRGRILGALLGAVLMGSLNNGMSLMNVPTFYQDTARGVVLLLAVAIDQLSRRR